MIGPHSYHSTHLFESSGDKDFSPLKNLMIFTIIEVNFDIGFLNKSIILYSPPSLFKQIVYNFRIKAYFNCLKAFSYSLILFSIASFSCGLADDNLSFSSAILALSSAILFFLAFILS